MFTEQDTACIRAHGLTPEAVERQLENFRRGFPFLKVVRAAAPGDGILVPAPQEVAAAVRRYDEAAARLGIVKFVPASGAATRMFKELFAFVEEGRRSEGIDRLLLNIERFAFWPELRATLPAGADDRTVVEHIIGKGLGYGGRPKGLVTFHAYAEGARKAAEEHLVEGAQYAAAGGRVRIHFTVSPEHRADFEALMAEKVPLYERRFGVHYDIAFSEQKPSTDTVAVNPDNTLFRTDAGALLFRPAGHGALLENLNEIDADVIFIKNIDNVAPDRLKTDTVTYKKVIGGVMLALQQRCHSYLRSLYNGLNDKVLIGEIARFTEERLGQRLPRDFERLSLLQRADLLYKLLDRPIRVCGMVRNEGEPGGGPFWVTAPDGSQSLQIAESSQIAPGQRQLMNAATHFNPVDVVCGTKNYRGEHFDLRKYVDPSTGFISQKSKSGRELLAQELPGLWNGSMAHWNTVFVEVPVTIFSPVKVVGDLLRPQHQAL